MLAPLLAICAGLYDFESPKDPFSELYPKDPVRYARGCGSSVDAVMVAVGSTLL